MLNQVKNARITPLRREVIVAAYHCAFAMVTCPLVVYAQQVFAINGSGIVGVIQKCCAHSEHLDVRVCVCT